MAAAAPSSVTSGDTDRRHKKLLLMQKKMQMSDAMEKRVQLESFAASRGGGRAVLSKNMRISIENDLDVALAAAGSGFGGSSCDDDTATRTTPTTLPCTMAPAERYHLLAQASELLTRWAAAPCIAGPAASQARADGTAACPWRRSVAPPSSASG
jgi:hypothetical protein